MFFFSHFNSRRRHSKGGGLCWTLRTGSCYISNTIWWGKKVLCVSLSLQVCRQLCSFVISIYLNVGRKGIRGHFYRHGEQWLLSEGMWTHERSGKQVEVWHHGGDARATFCLHVWAGEGAERVAAGPHTGPAETHDTTGLYQWVRNHHRCRTHSESSLLYSHNHKKHSMKM